ncbi:MAG: transposase [Actinobacteria bacterium]|nr:transposase [Actinomycetota bacterium]MCG2801042.1 transposase [Cellulomonas sp.]
MAAPHGVDNDDHREVLGVQITTAATKEPWHRFFADLVEAGGTSR